LADAVSNLPEHLTDLFNRSLVNLTDDNKLVFANVLIRYQDQFARNDFDLGCLKGVKHKIDTGDNPPFKVKMRRTPLQFQGQEEEHLKKLIQCVAGTLGRQSSRVCQGALQGHEEGFLSLCHSLPGQRAWHP
jgi:hypothetical protein